MQMYEYQCKKCEHAFEAIQKLDEKPLRKCPKCESKNSLVKLISGSLIKFSGEGWTPKFHN